MDYEHTQTGPLTAMVLVFFLFILIVTMAAGDDGGRSALIVGAAMAPIIAIVFAFSRLTVTVDPGHVAARSPGAGLAG